MGDNYSDLPNNCAANLITFWEKNTYTTLLGPTSLLISEILLSKPDFHLCKWEKNPSYTALRPTRLLILRNLPPTRLNGPTRLFGRLEYFFELLIKNFSTVCTINNLFFISHKHGWSDTWFYYRPINAHFYLWVSIFLR